MRSVILFAILTTLATAPAAAPAPDSTAAAAFGPDQAMALAVYWIVGQLLFYFPIVSITEALIKYADPLADERTSARAFYWILWGGAWLTLGGALIFKARPAFAWPLILGLVAGGGAVTALFALAAARYTGNPYAEDRSAEWRIAKAGPYERFPLEQSSHHRWATKQETWDKRFGPGRWDRMVRRNRIILRVLGVVLSLIVPLVFLPLHGVSLLSPTRSELWSLGAIGLGLSLLNTVAILLSVHLQKPTP
jgi:hypothetical protein